MAAGEIDVSVAKVVERFLLRRIKKLDPVYGLLLT